MARTNPTPVAPELRDSYPRLTADDAEVWEKWLVANKDQITEVYYDVALGGVIIEDDEVDEATRDGWQYNTAVKPDVVAVLAGENLAIEVKPFARLGAIGQALGYAVLLDAEPLNNLPNVPTIITNDASQEIRTVAQAFGVRLIVIRDSET